MEKKNMSIIGDSLKRKRERAGYSIEKLANLLDVEVELISKWENGTEEPTISQILVLSKLYGMSVNDIFHRVEVEREIPEEMRDDFRRSVRANRISNRSYW